jgi:hypothetical protein
MDEKSQQSDASRNDEARRMTAAIQADLGNQAWVSQF